MFKPNNKCVKLILLILLISIFAACSNTRPNTLEEIVVSPTETKLPPIATFTIAPTPKIHPMLTLPPDYLNEAQKLPKNCQENVGTIIDPSPDDAVPTNWILYTCPETAEFFILNRENSKTWHLQINQIPGVHDYERFSYVHWSKDGRYFYFALVPQNNPCCWDSGVTEIDSTFSDLWQFNLDTGNYFNVFENVAPIASDNYPSMSSISFSPNEKTLLIIPQRWIIPPIVYLYDLEKNKVFYSSTLTGSKDSIVAGNIVWYPNGQYFALVSASGGDFEYYQEGQNYKDALFSVVVINFKTLSQKVIISETKKYVYLRKITTDNILKIESSEPATASGQGAITYDEYDITTNQFLISTPTSSP